MFRNCLGALAVGLMPWILSACGCLECHRAAQQPLTQPSQAAAIPLPGGDWTCETRRVKTVTPESAAYKEITYYKNSIGMEFVLVPAGRFGMGSAFSAAETARRFGGDAEDYADEHPMHDVRISRAFLIGAHETTNAQYRRFRPHHNSNDYEGVSLNGDTQPVTCVSNDDARLFCDWLSEREGLTYRLPTEAEWEYACRAGSQTLYPWGDRINSRYCNFADANAATIPWRDEATDDDYPATAPVGSFPANTLGLYDMIGNVWECCLDWYDVDNYAKSPAEDPKGPAAARSMNRVMRGGSWMNDAASCRSAFRMHVSQASRAANNGFRVILELAQE